MLVDGKWQNDWQVTKAIDEHGRFARQISSFRNWVTPDGSAGPTGVGGFQAEPGRYHLYIALNCPWACRALIFRKLKKLDNVISVSIAVPEFTEQGYAFGDYPGALPARQGSRTRPSLPPHRLPGSWRNPCDRRHCSRIHRCGR